MRWMWLMFSFTPWCVGWRLCWKGWSVRWDTNISLCNYFSLKLLKWFLSQRKAQCLHQTKHQTVRLSRWDNRCSLKADMTHTLNSLFNCKSSFQRLFLIVRGAHMAHSHFSHITLNTALKVMNTLTWHSWHGHAKGLLLARSAKVCHTV